jgi:hypothetical protein
VILTARDPDRPQRVGHELGPAPRPYSKLTDEAAAAWAVRDIRPQHDGDRCSGDRLLL